MTDRTVFARSEFDFAAFAIKPVINQHFGTQDMARAGNKP
jgi:hypothetical protein